ncbi:OmpA family protein [Devosia sp.]|uniref:OmpA family protein n=1 Tax=Devosia sp. TaxID=1871048 RepID=UPI003BAD86F1
MFSRKAAVIAAILSVSFVPATAFAAPSTLSLIIGGEAYDGAPRFEVSFDGKPVGEAAVDTAIDTVSSGRFADAADKSAYVQSFDFPIPEALFKPGGEVRVRLINEAYGGDGSNHDRNLYLAAVSVNGRAVTVSGLRTQGTKADQGNEVLGEFLVLRDGNMEGVSMPPAGGWPQPGAAVASVAAQPAPSMQMAPVVVAKLHAPEPAGGTVQTASLDTSENAEPQAACNRDELYNVIGFNENSNDLTPRLKARLDQIIADIGTQKCRVLVTGYSSRQGSHATSALFAIERAQNVLAYLKAEGIAFDKATATGGGATEQFGEAPGANRRVVISVTP